MKKVLLLVLLFILSVSGCSCGCEEDLDKVIFKRYPEGRVVYRGERHAYVVVRRHCILMKTTDLSCCGDKDPDVQEVFYDMRTCRNLEAKARVAATERKEGKSADVAEKSFSNNSQKKPEGDGFIDVVITVTSRIIAVGLGVLVIVSVLAIPFILLTWWYKSRSRAKKREKYGHRQSRVVSVRDVYEDERARVVYTSLLLDRADSIFKTAIAYGIYFTVVALILLGLFELLMLVFRPWVVYTFVSVWAFVSGTGLVSNIIARVKGAKIVRKED